MLFLGKWTWEQSIAAIYRQYPRRVGHRKALLEIERAIKRLTSKCEGPMTEEEAIEGLLVATARFAHSPAGQRGGFTPHPATWFHQSRYMDDEKEWFNVPTAEGIAECRIRSNDDAFARVFSESPQGDCLAFQRAIDRRRFADMERPSQLLLGIGGD